MSHIQSTAHPSMEQEILQASGLRVTELSDKNQRYEDQEVKQERETGTTSMRYPTGWKLALIIAPLCLGTLLIAIDNTILAVAIPTITTEFNSLQDIGWYGSAYLLAVTALQPTFGNIYKHFHVKAAYLISIVIFEVGSTLCAAAPNSSIFILGRAVAGIGAAGVFQGALGIVGFKVPLEKRPFYLGIVVSVFGLATCFGPVVGGALTSNVSWRWCFWINLPIGFFSFLMILTSLKMNMDDNDNDRRLSFKEKMMNMDIPGSLALIAALCCLLLALQWGGTTFPWNSSTIIGLFVGFGLIFIVFVLLQWKSGNKASIPLRILRQRSVLMGCLYTFFVSMSNYTDGYYFPFYFQSVQNVSAITSGVRFIPLAAPEVLAIVVTGAIITKKGHYVPFMVAGAALGAIGTGLLTTIGLATTTVQWAAYLVITGIGIGMGIQLPYTAVQVVLSGNDVLIGNAITTFFAQLGGALAVPVGGTLLVNALVREIPLHTDQVPAQSVIEAGATNLGRLTGDPDVLRALQSSYSIAVRDTLYFALAAISIAVPFAVGMEWRNVKRVFADGKQGAEGSTAVLLSNS